MCLTLTRFVDTSTVVLELLSDTLAESVGLCDPDFMPNSELLPSRDVMPDELCVLLHAIATAARIEDKGKQCGEVNGADIRSLFEQIVAFERSGARAAPAPRYAQHAQRGDDRYAWHAQTHHAAGSIPDAIGTGSHAGMDAEQARPAHRAPDKDSMILLSRTLLQLGARIGGVVPMELVVTGLNGWPAGRRTTARSSVALHLWRDDTNINMRITPQIHPGDRAFFKGCGGEMSTYEYKVPFSDLHHSTILCTAAETARRQLTGNGAMVTVSALATGRALKSEIARAMKITPHHLSKHLQQFSVVDAGLPIREEAPAMMLAHQASPRLRQPAGVASVGAPGSVSSGRGDPANHAGADASVSARPRTEAHDRAAKSFKRNLRNCLTGYVRGNTDWQDAELLITGLDGMDDAPPQGLETYVHLIYEQKSGGDVELKIDWKNRHYPDLKPLYRTFSRTDYRNIKTLYKELLFAGIFTTFSNSDKWPISVAASQFRDRIAKKLSPKMRGKKLADAVLAFKPIEKPSAPRHGALRQRVDQVSMFTQRGQLQQFLVPMREQVLADPVLAKFVPAAQYRLHANACAMSGRLSDNRSRFPQQQ